MRTRQAYPSDVTDQEWRLVEPLIPAQKQTGRRRSVDERELLNAILYLMRTRCSWRMLPHDLPPWGTVYYHYCRWQEDGTLRRIHKKLGR